MTSRKTQRALVLQGGVAIGAYEAGIFKGLYDRLYKPGESLFDIVAGTSIGAINAAILVSHTQNDKKGWEDSYKTLQSFWQHVGSSTPVSGITGEYWLGEAGRRYYSTKEFFITGIDKVFDAPEQVLDYRFHDYYPYFFGLPNTTANTRHRYNNERFRESIKKFAQFPIATTSDRNFDNKEEIVGPRLLTVAVDVLDGSTVTFDSYNYKGKRCLICWQEFDSNDKLIDHVNSSHRGNIKNNKLRWSVYGQEGDNNRGAIFYNNGIDLTHVMASGAFPTAFDYEKIEGRGFWDGGILSNTPLRELIQKHRDYWYKDLGKQEVPDLELYIVNVWPSKEATNRLPVDYDSLKDRRNDLTYHDKTGYDIKVAEMVNDYIDYIKALRGAAQEAISSVQNAAKRKELTERLEGIGRPETKSSKKREGDPKKREYKDLLEGRFKLVKVVKIERKDDVYNVSNKWADFTFKTIAEMMKQGEDDAWKVQI
jgi:predicted acylesterase/phospholipase RssA